MWHLIALFHLCLSDWTCVWKVLYSSIHCHKSTTCVSSKCLIHSLILWSVVEQYKPNGYMWRQHMYCPFWLLGKKNQWKLNQKRTFSLKTCFSKYLWPFCSGPSIWSGMHGVIQIPTSDVAFFLYFKWRKGWYMVCKKTRVWWVSWETVFWEKAYFAKCSTFHQTSKYGVRAFWSKDSALRLTSHFDPRGKHVRVINWWFLFHVIQFSLQKTTFRNIVSYLNTDCMVIFETLPAKYTCKVYIFQYMYIIGYHMSRFQKLITLWIFLLVIRSSLQDTYTL